MGTTPDGTTKADQALSAALDRRTVARFWRHTRPDTDHDADEACLLWTGGKTKAGYGVFSLPGDAKVLAHRLAWRIRNGPIPPGLFVRHRCDNPICVRPSHLQTGTNAQNMVDAVRRGRHGTARLTADQVRDIRRLRAEGESVPAIAAAVAATAAAVNGVLRGRSYRWVDAADTPTM